MRAIEITQYGAPEVLRAGERPDPVPAAGEVLIRVTASGVNRPDVLQRKGMYNPPPGASPAEKNIPYAWEKEARKYYIQHPEQFPTTQPATPANDAFSAWLTQWGLAVLGGLTRLTRPARN